MKALGADVADEKGEGHEGHGEETGGHGEGEGRRGAGEALHAEDGGEAGGGAAGGGEDELEARGAFGEGVVVEAGEVFEVAELFLEGELGFTVPAVAEEDGDFDDALDAALDHEFEGDFVADGIEGFGIGETGAAEGEEAGHGIADGADEGLGEEGGGGAVEPAEEAPVFGFAAEDVAGAEDEIGLVGD